MLGIGRGVTLSLAGWLWADILLGLFAIFLAANTVGAATQTALPGIDPSPVTLSLAVDGPTLLGTDANAIATEQQRIAAAVNADVAQKAAGRKVAIVIAFAAHADPADDAAPTPATAAVRRRRGRRSARDRPGRRLARVPARSKRWRCRGRRRAGRRCRGRGGADPAAEPRPRDPRGGRGRRR